MADIQRLIEADTFYLPALYDFVFLDKTFHEAPAHRIREVIEYPITEAGVVVDAVHDTLPFPDLFHFVQTTHAFAEKAFKFFLVLRGGRTDVDQVAKRYRHDLLKLVLDCKTIVPELFAKLHSEGLADTLNAISHIDFVKLRYLEEAPTTLEINAVKLKHLNKMIMDHMKELRWTYCYSSKEMREKLREHGDKYPRVVVSCPVLEEPAPSISVHRMREIQASSILDQGEKDAIAAAYSGAGVVLQLRADLKDEVQVTIFRSLLKAGFAMPDLNTISIRIQSVRGNCA